MKYIKILDVKPGDIVALPILKDDGAVLLGEGTVITDGYINKLKESSVESIYILEDKLEIVENMANNYSDIRNKGIETISSIYDKILNLETVHVKEITPVVNNMIDIIKSKVFPLEIMEKIKLKDDFTYLHCLNTCFLSLFFGEYIKLSNSDLEILGTSALLHDIGKIKIKDSILNKNGKLTPAEYEEIKMHTIYGRDMLSSIQGINNKSISVALNHHERYDGSGYPNGLKGDEIDAYSQIVSICDIYDALINSRSYKHNYKPGETFEYILSKGGTYFNINLVKAFRDCIHIYPDGIGVKLSDGRLGYVREQNYGYPSRPVVSIITDKDGSISPPHEINLMNILNIVIDDIII